MRTPIPWLQEGIKEYNRTHGLGVPKEGHWKRPSQIAEEQIAYEYEALPRIGKGREVLRAYDQLAEQVEEQWTFAVKELGVLFIPTEQDPYKTSAEMQADVRDKRTLRVFAGNLEHPLLSPDENLMFRGVHDLFGHAAEGYQFGPRGEFNAWLHHCQMFGQWAGQALTTETRGQNAWVNYGPHRDKPACERPFAEQKAALLPAWVWDWEWVLEHYQD